MTNIYDTIVIKPGLKPRHMPEGLEELARQLVASGRFRVDTVVEQNFVRWGRPFEGINMVFSHREVLEPDLIPRTSATMKRVLQRGYRGSALTKKITEELARLQQDTKKNIDVDKDVELQLARLIVQSADPAVILLILAEGAEVYVSYSYSVGDMLDIQTWQEAGDSSGLQSTGHSGNAVFVSCGGNPLGKKSEERPYDGDESLARMVIIAGQELGHFADIIRDKRGWCIGRYSADYRYGRATEIARKGRLDDIATTLAWRQKAYAIGLKSVAEVERSLKFFRQHRKWSLVVPLTKIKAWIYQAVFILACKFKGYDFFSQFYREEYMCSTIAGMFEDMLFNLEPNNDAYKRPDPVEEEMIMCIEALARVQQQANKWGMDLTRLLYPNLYDLYYKQVIPGCIATYEKITGQGFPGVFRRSY